MTRIEYLTQIADLFQYKTIHDPEGNEYVVYANSVLTKIHPVEDKTAFEAVENHVHIIDSISKKEFETLIPVAKKLGPAVLGNLTASFPEKKFTVYVTVTMGQSLIVRFHQQWEGESPYYNPSDFRSEKERVFAFSN